MSAAPEPTSADVPQRILDLLEARNGKPIETGADLKDVSQVAVKAALDRLASRSMIAYKAHDRDVVTLTAEAEEICRDGSHEYRVWKVVNELGRLAIADLPSKVGAASAEVGRGNAFKNKWIKKDGDSLIPVAKDGSIEDKTQKTLLDVQSTHQVSDAKVLADLKRRKLVTVGKVISYTATKGPKFATTIPVEVTDLTFDMLASGSWKSAAFKPYNFKALGGSQSPGALHPLNKVRAEFRNIFFNQGFIEMPTSRFVESGFWNFDTLFVPQQHPARDSQDTFFISDPVKADKPRADPVAEQAMSIMEGSNARLYANPDDETKVKPRDYEQYWTDVHKVHQEGAFGSTGYRYPWSADETLRLVLRTHTTAVSGWCLHRLAENPRPARYFSIDRVFRNESVDATHLAEFHQVEGVIADFGLTLGGLMRFLEDFFSRLGIDNLRFKPAYNPYTEPSMEVFGFHRGLDRWVEIGNSGMFRPEMLLPMGLPADLRVYGFGLSLERPTMIRYGVSNIRDLLGHKVDLGFVESNPAVRFDKS